jgi:hypothetical protein
VQHRITRSLCANQMKTSKDPHYCERVTANDGALGEQYLRDFQDNEKTVPTILTTSQKLSTGVDARNGLQPVQFAALQQVMAIQQSFFAQIIALSSLAGAEIKRTLSAIF